jgi:hypothetical protein
MNRAEIFTGGCLQFARRFRPAERRLRRNGHLAPGDGRKIIRVGQDKQRRVIQRNPFAGVVRQRDLRDIRHGARRRESFFPERKNEGHLRRENKRHERQPPLC